MHKIRLTLMVSIIAMVACIPASRAGQTELLYVVTPAVYGQHATVHQKIKDECKLDEAVANRTAELARKLYADVILIDDVAKAGTNKVLVLTITQAYGFGGGRWSGPKGITVETRLMQNGQVLATNTRSSNSRGSPFSISTCSIFDRTVKQIAGLNFKWLKQLQQQPAGSKTPPQDPVEPEQAVDETDDSI